MRILMIRNALAHRGRLTLTVLAVALSVSFVTASFVLADTLRSVFSDVSDNIYGNVDAEIRAGDGAFDQLVTGDRFDEAELAAIERIDGVAEVAPVLGARNEIFTIDADGEVQRQAGPPTLAFSSMGTSPASPFTIVTGSPPGQGQIMLDTAQADALGVGVGDSIDVATSGGIERFEVSGTLAFGEGDAGVSPYFLLFDRTTMQRLVGASGMVDSASIRLDDGADRDVVLDRVRSSLPAGLAMVDRAQLIDEQNTEFGVMIGLVRTALLIFAGITLFVSTFVIANTFAVLVGQQRRQVGLLRAVGASGRQAAGVVAAEALVVGIIASAAGLAGGLAVAEGIKALVASVTDGGFPEGATQFLPRTVVVGLVLGIGVTVVSASVPALRASRVGPLEAMGDPDAGVLPSSRFGRTLRRFATATVGWMGVPGGLGAASVARNPKRVLTTSMSMIVGLAVIAAMAVVSSSYRSTIGDVAAGGFDADVVVTGTDGVAVPYAAMVDVLELDVVDAASGFGTAEVRSDGEIVSLGGFQSAHADGVVVLELTDGRASDLAIDEVVVTTDLIESEGIAFGSTIPAEFSDGVLLDLRVVGVVEPSAIAAADLLVDEALITAHARNVDADIGAIRFAEGVDPGAAFGAVDEALAAYPQLSVATLADHVADREAQAQQLLMLANGLLALTIVVALTGIANTVALSMMERRREIGLLRAVGMSRRQLRQMVRSEALVLSLVGAVIGLVAGVAIALVAVAFIPDALVGRVEVPVGSLAVYGAISVGFGVLAAALPARRAANAEVLQAIAPR